MSWPVGRGRRQWISVGPLAAAVLGWVWIAWWAIWLALAIVYWTVYGLCWLVSRPFVAWKAHQAPVA